MLNVLVESCRRFCSRLMPVATTAALIALLAIALSAQSPNPFGQPSGDKPQPGATINAVPGSRAQGWAAQGRSEVLARHGIVATSDPLAAQAGLEILRQGGNAIDAAVAAGAVLDVTSQNDTGIGGDLGRSAGRPVAAARQVNHWPAALHRHPSFGRTMVRKRRRHAPASRPGLPVMTR